MRRYGAEGQRLARLARGIDDRTVDPVRETKSVSAETTFNTTSPTFRPLEQYLWAAAERGVGAAEGQASSPARP